MSLIIKNTNFKIKLTCLFEGREFMKKPISIIVLSFILLFFGAANFLGGATYLINGLSIIGLIVGLITIIQGITALIASIGLWRLDDWAEKAFIVWASICVIRFIFMRLFVYPVPFLRIVLMVAVITAIFVVVHKYIYQKNKNLFYIVDIDKLAQRNQL